MLQYVSRDATLFIQSRWRQVFHFHFCFFSLSGTREVAQWCGTACGRRPVGHRNKMASTTLSERRHLECVIGSPSLSQSVSVQCSVRLPQKWEEEKKKNLNNKKRLVRQVDKGVVRVPRGCFGNNVRSRPCDFSFSFFFSYIYSWLTSGLSFHPQRSPLNCPSVSHLPLTWLRPQICVYRLLTPH